MENKINILQAATDNENFRQVLFTGLMSQLVIMTIPPGEEIGEEMHNNVEQMLFFLSGTGEAMLDDKTFAVGVGDVVVVAPGVRHNFKNDGTKDLKIYTVYAPSNHIDGRVHKTKAEADADTEDEAFGEANG